MYKRLINGLRAAGYRQHQYSSYVQNNSLALAAWFNMIDLCTIRPLGVLQTTARNLWIYRAPHRLLYNAAHLIEPGGPLFDVLPGPVPASLAPLPTWGFFAAPPAPLKDAALIPPEVRFSPASRNPQNWVR